MYSVNELLKARRIWAARYKNIHLHPNDLLWFKSQIVSASFRNFLPDIEPEKHEALFKKLLLNLRIADMEQSMPELLKELPTHFCEGNNLEQIRKVPGVIATFHTGSFRLIGHYLAINQIPFTLVVSGNGLKREDSLVDTVYNTEQRETIGFDLIDANEKSCMLKICRALKEKRNVLIYVDGNTGVGEEIDNENLIEIPFLGQQISIRTGASFAAGIANVPLYPVICRRRWHYTTMLEFKPPIMPNHSLNRKEFAAASMSTIYRYLETIVKEKPWQWEGWLYLHHCAKVVAEDSLHITESQTQGGRNRKVMFNRNDYSFFRLDGKCFLFRKIDYACFEVEQWLYIRLQQLYEGNYKFTVPMLERNRMKDLIRNRVVLEY